MSYKDQTFCGDWCDNKECFRNYCHIEEAMKPGGFLATHDWMPVCYFVEVPVDCTARIPKNENI